MMELIDQRATSSQYTKNENLVGKIPKPTSRFFCPLLSISVLIANSFFDNLLTKIRWYSQKQLAVFSLQGKNDLALYFHECAFTSRSKVEVNISASHSHKVWRGEDHSVGNVFSARQGRWRAVILTALVYRVYSQLTLRTHRQKKVRWNGMGDGIKQQRKAQCADMSSK